MAKSALRFLGGLALLRNLLLAHAISIGQLSDQVDLLTQRGLMRRALIVDNHALASIEVRSCAEKR